MTREEWCRTRVANAVAGSDSGRQKSRIAEAARRAIASYGGENVRSIAALRLARVCCHAS